MKIFKTIINILSVVFVVSCNIADINDQKQVVFSFKPTEVNNDLERFAKVVSRAISENEEFKKIIKEEALVQFDGDYDVLVNRLKDRRMKSIDMLKSNGEEVTVKSFLEGYYNESVIDPTLKSATSIIEELLKKYPDIQISVPVHAEKWDPETFTPNVVFVYEEMEELVTPLIPGYDSIGNQILMDAIAEPDEPVIVVKFCERYKENNKKLKSANTIPKPPAPTNLTLLNTETGIRLTWQKNTTATSQNTTGYIVNKVNSQGVLAYKATLYGLNSVVYTDGDVDNRNFYTYQVVAFYDEYYVGREYSDPTLTATIQAAQKPNAVVSFDAELIGYDNIRLKWDHDYSQFITNTYIEKMTHNIDFGFQTWKTLDPNDVNCFDNNLTEGCKVEYCIRESSVYGESNAKYDIVHVPYRDITQTSQIIVEYINTDVNAVEAWYNGKPEFYLSLSGVDLASKQTTKRVGPIDFQFYARTNLCYFHYNFYGWNPGFWYDAVTFHLIEYERIQGQVEIPIEAIYKTKDADKKNITTRIGLQGKITYKNDGTYDCGIVDLTYYDHPGAELLFNHHTSIKINDGVTADLNTQISGR